MLHEFMKDTKHKILICFFLFCRNQRQVRATTVLHPPIPVWIAVEMGMEKRKGGQNSSEQWTVTFAGIKLTITSIMEPYVSCKQLSRSAHRTPNFTNPKHFVCLLFEYFFQIKGGYLFRSLRINSQLFSTYTVFPHIVPAETILFGIWKSKGHST